MKCKICQYIKNLRFIDVILIALICVGMYIANHFQMQSYYQERAQKQAQEKAKEQQKLKDFENTQRKCYFQQDKAACERLKQF